MNEENLRNSFSKVKEDILDLKAQIQDLLSEFNQTKKLMENVLEEINNQKLERIADIPSYNLETDKQTIRQLNETYSVDKTDNKTVPWEIGGLKTPYFNISTGNEGVKTDKQTNKQTDRIEGKSDKSIESDIQEASFILESLDRLKRDIRLKFKRVTEQEMAVFSTIYQLEENYPHDITYQKIAKTLNLSESAIRDYVRRMLQKGIPLKKDKINNKKVVLSISEELKRIATLSTIIKLREL